MVTCEVRLGFEDAADYKTIVECKDPRNKGDCLVATLCRITGYQTVEQIRTLVSNTGECNPPTQKIIEK